MIGFNELPDHEKSKLISGPFGRQLMLTMEKSACVLLWQERGADGPNSGSVFFVRTSKALFGVTASHVFEAYKEASRRDNRAVSHINNLQIDLLPRFISKGKNSDIATFAISEPEFEKLERLTVPWPPHTPAVGNTVMASGFPAAIGRRQSVSGIPTFGFYYSSTSVDSVSSSDISMVREPDEHVTDVSGNGLPPRGIEMGGMSGGPVVAILERGGIVSWSISGVIYECQPYLEIVKAARADLIEENGEVVG